MTRKTFLGVVLALAVFGGGVYAQDRIFAFRGAFVDIPIEAPCVVVSTSMAVYDRNPWLVFTCNTGQVILRRYMNPNDNVIAPVRVTIVDDASQTETPSLPAEKPAVYDTCPTPDPVTGVYGLCKR